MSKNKNGGLDQYGKVKSLNGSAVKGLRRTKMVCQFFGPPCTYICVVIR